MNKIDLITSKEGYGSLVYDIRGLTHTFDLSYLTAFAQSLPYASMYSPAHPDDLFCRLPGSGA
jgi:hypothetical protein